MECINERATLVFWLQHDPIANSDNFARCHQRFVQLVHDTELQTLKIATLKLERRSLEPKLPDFLIVRSNFLLKSSVQLLHPNCGRNTHRQSTSSTTRVNRQIDSLSNSASTGTKVYTLVGFPLISCLFLDSFPSLPVS